MSLRRPSLHVRGSAWHGQLQSVNRIQANLTLGMKI
jgi:hypothetical protein